LRFALVSDLHIDINEKRRFSTFTSTLIDYLSTLSIDGLIVTGDIAGKNSYLDKFFRLSSKLEIEYQIFVPGNHDVWVNHKAEDLSWFQLEQYLPQLCQKYGWHYLPGDPLSIGQIGIVGTMGWYDYSLRNMIWDDVVNFSDYERKVNPHTGYRWMDRSFAKFGKSTDEDLLLHFLQQLECDIQLSLEINPSKMIVCTHFVPKMIVCTHFVPFREFVQYHGVLANDYFTAFYGSSKLGELILKYASELKQMAVVFGHTHQPKIQTLYESITGYCVPIGYPREYGDIELEDLFNQRIHILSI
jgi:putative phosphoesterase